ncbi:MAG: FtsX-like permease family protein [Prevotellaceae bacterium]|jgi:lipoprotein-releasing system permease protein|nr:FtsX-like permease family protein [Prevotellaceae bacterium]
MQKDIKSAEFFIARRITTDKTNGTKLSRLMVRIATGSVAVSLTVMLLAIMVTAGFQSEIRNKAVGLTGHVVLSNYDGNTSFEAAPIDIRRADIPAIMRLKGVRHAQPVATKGGIIKTNDEIQGAVLKGMDATCDPQFFSSCLVTGEVPAYTDTALSNRVLVPLRLARQLRLDTGSRFDMYFVQEPLRVRRFTVGGIYNAQLDDMVNALVVCDINHIRTLNGWSREQASAVEVFTNDFAQMNTVAETIDDMQAFNMDEEGVRLKVQTVTDLYQFLFDWLNLLDMNVWIILVLMLLVGGFNMISGLLIMVFEKMSMIGLLKALGMRNAGVQRVFLYRAAFITLRGMLWGNLIAFALVLLQQHFHFIALDPVTYYVDSVPVLLQPVPVLLVNVFGFIGITLLLALPVLIISRISPDRTIKAE